MVNFPGRNGRRRRVLNEEVLSASTSHAALRAMTDDGEALDAPRYSDAANVENHPQITDFVPRRYRTIALLVLSSAVSVSVFAALHYFAAPIAAAAGIADAAPFDLAAPGSLAAWVATVVLLAASATCLLVYSIRRHRIDDYRGRYRVWLAAAAACLLLSANSVAGLHHVMSDALGHFSGWTALRGGAVWWLALAGWPLAWIALRVLLDVRECRLAASLLVAAIVCYVASIGGFLGLSAASDSRLEPATTGTAALLGHWLLLTAVVSYARFVVLDAQGLVTVRRRPSSQRQPRKVVAESRAEQLEQPAARKTSLFAAASLSWQSQPPQPAKSPAAESQWVDGSRPERDSYDDDGDDDLPGDDRKLSKSERKRLRKLKAQHRAA